MGDKRVFREADLECSCKYYHTKYHKILVFFYEGICTVLVVVPVLVWYTYLYTSTGSGEGRLG